jgi:tryptophanyl-tRNA synthetase
MIFFIDFDGTICPNTTSLPPQKECIEVLNLLKSHNHKICIYSCRANEQCVENKEEAVREMVRYLDDHKVPYHEIVHDKPLFNYCIDDRNIGTPLTSDYVVDWKVIKQMIEKA